MSMYFPFESMSRAISGPSVLVGAGQRWKVTNYIYSRYCN